MFRTGQIEIDFASRIVKKDGVPVKLTRTEYDLLRLLARNVGKLLTQRELLKQVWGPGAVEHSHYLRVYVGQLRRKLERDPSRPELIITESGID